MHCLVNHRLPPCAKMLAASLMGFLPFAAESADPDAYDPHAGRRLVWSDEFDGQDLDVSKWNFRQTMMRPEAVYDNGPDTVWVEDGFLKMMVRRSGNAAKPWKLPQGVTTADGMSFKYGYLEMRARLPFRNGAWPSFWTQTTEGLRKAGYMAEVDIFESISTAGVSSTLHKWQGAKHAMGDGGGFTFPDASNLPNEYHVYGFEWNPKEMTFSVDGTVYWTRPIDNAHDFGSSTIAGMEGFHDYMFVILNNEIVTASKTGMTPEQILPDDTPIPVEYWVDWIRLYQDPNTEYLNAKTDDRRSVGHTPLEAWAAGVNPGVGSQGGTWTASRRERANDPVSAGALMTRFVQTTRKVGFGSADKSQAGVYVVCGDGPYEEDGCVFSPGEIVLKPTSKGYGNWRVAVTYEVPRSGWYSMSARFRAADTSADGKVDTTVLVDGIVLQWEELTRTEGGAPVWGHACSFAHKFLAKGTRLEFVVGPEWKDYNDWWNLHANDATALALSIVEEKTVDESETVIADLGSAIGGLTTQTAGATGTVSDPSGLGTWSLYHFTRTASFADASARLPLSRTEANDVGEKGVAFRSATLEGADPQVKVNGGSSAVALGVTEQTWIAPYDTVAPGEIVLNPSSEQSVGLRFVPELSGGYVVSVVARDLAMSFDYEGTWGDSGVDVSVAVNGGVRFSSRVSAERQMALGCYQWLFGSTDVLQVSGGTPIDIVIDPRSGAAYDYTGLSVRVVKVPSSLVGWDASCALYDVARTGNASVLNGGDWSFGSARTIGKSGDFQKMTAVTVLSSNYRGLTGGGATIAGSMTMERHKAADEGLSGWGCGNGDPWIAEDEFVIIPASQVYGVCRFTVPADGIYSVEAVCHDLNMAWNMSYPGVFCRLFANDRLLAEGQANVDAWANPPLVANLTADRLYLRAGDVIDLGVYSPTGSGGWSLETAVSLRVSALGPAPDVVSLDISPASATVYAGRGLVGYESDAPTPWSSVGPVGGGRNTVSASSLRRPDGTRTQMGFALSPPAGGEFAVLMAGEGLLSDGVVSVGSGVRYGWSLTGLAPDEDYTLYLYGVGAATFTVDETTVGLTGSWSGGATPDFAVLRVRSDRDGVVSGEFSGLADAIGVFCGLQVEGPKTPDYTPGMAVIVR